MPGRFKLDENLPRDAEVLLRKAGHNVDTVLAERLGGEPDPTVLEAAKAEDRVLITLDLDFSDIRRYPPSDYPGIWVLRPSSQSIGSVAAMLGNALAVFETESAAHQLWIIEPRRVRIHE